MVQRNIRLKDHLEIHDRGEDRAAALSGVVTYVKNGKLHTIDSGGVVEKPLVAGQSDTTASVAPGFGTWTEADANRPTFLEADVTVQTDGTSRGEVVIDVDEDGGTTADYSLVLGHIDPDNASGAIDKDGRKVYLPPGAQYQVRNVSDPSASNSIDTVRQVTL